MTSSQATAHNPDRGTTQSSHASAIHILFDTCERILNQHRADNPDIYRLVDLKKQQAAISGTRNQCAVWIYQIIKKYIHSLGCSATMKLIKETLFNPWLSLEWYDEQLLKIPQLRLQLE